MEVVPVTLAEQRRSDELFNSRKVEFEAASFAFDVPHLLAQEVAEFTLLALTERAWRENVAEWYVANLHAVVVAIPKSGTMGECTFTMNGKRSSRSVVVAAIAVSSLIGAEARVK